MVFRTASAKHHPALSYVHQPASHSLPRLHAFSDLAALTGTRQREKGFSPASQVAH